MSTLIAAYDWSSSPLGPESSWPQALKTLIDVMLGSSQPMFVTWGQGRTLLYNDSYAEVLASKHPSALGRDFLEVWEEIRPDLTPIVERAYAGQPVRMDDIELHMLRRGYLEETHFSFSYTPVRDDQGDVAGFFCPCVEITTQVLAERRQAFRLTLEERLRSLTDPREAIAAAVEMLGRHLGANRAGYGEVQEDDATVLLHSSFANGVLPLEGEFPLNGFGTAMIARQREGRTQSCDDVQGDPGHDAEVWAAIQTRAFVSVPLIREGRFAASLYVNFAAPHHWTAAEIALIEEVAARTWAAVDGARAERRLRQNEARLRLALEASRLAEVTFVLPDGVAHSPTFAELFGHPPDKQLTLAEIRAQYHPDDHDRAVAERAMILNGEQSFYEIAKRIVRPSGEVRWIYGRGSVERDTHGRAVSVTAVYLDETERKQAEAALRESEARLRAVFEQAAAGFARTDLTGRFKQVNDRYCTIVGRSRDELLTLRMQDITHPDDLVPNVPQFETTAAGGSPFEIEKRYLRPDGTTVWVRNSVSAVRDDGADKAVLAVTIDISDRKRAEEALRQLNETLENQVAERTAERDRMWNTSPDLMLVIDFDGYFRRVNPAWTALLGYTPHELIGHHVNEFVLLEDHEPTVEAYESAAQGGRPSIVNRYRHKDGSTRWISWAAAPADDMTYATGRDVTAEKQREAELLATQEALRQSQKLEAMGQLTGGVAHDFNNLLTPIVGSLDMLQRQRLGGEREQRLIAGAAQSADRAKTLVQRLLAFARRQPLQPTGVDMGALVEGMADLLGSTIGPQIRLIVEKSPDLPQAQADPNQLEMALLNLGVNARDAMPDGGTLCISVSTDCVEFKLHGDLEPGQYVLLSVTDTGVGMDDATLKRAVEPFFSTKGIGKGTGLGLSMVHGLASQLGGAVRIQSKVGVGTTVKLWLRASTDPAQLAAPADQLTMAPARTGRVLLVDDEELVRLSTADMLTDLGYEVTEARSAEEALHIIGSRPRFDLLVTDHLMEGMTGAQLASEMRATLPSLPVLIVSGYAEADGILVDLPRLTKPFRRDDLLQALSSMRLPRPGSSRPPQ